MVPFSRGGSPLERPLQRRDHQERMVALAFNTASFLFFVFPLLILLYALAPGRRGKNVFLLVASLAFYAAGQWQGLPCLLLTALLSWLAGVFLPRVRAKRVLLALILALELLSLGVFKYLNFFTGILRGLTGLDLPEWNLLLPVGIDLWEALQWRRIQSKI